MTRRIDYSALTRTVSKAEVLDFKKSAKSKGWGAVGTGQLITMVIFAVVGGLIFVSVISAFIALGMRSFAENPSPVSFIAAAFPLIFAALFATLAIVLIAKAVGRARWEKWFRLDAFATANGLHFSASDPSPSYPGAIFQLGHSRVALDHLRSTEGRFVDFGNYRYTVGSGKNQTTHNWGFLALKLDRALPHIVLDSRANNGLFGASNLPAFFAQSQKLSLEGDFDKYFTLYCPTGYERDALYVFTPDLMALLIDEAAPFDVEIVDDWMFVYSAAPFTVKQPATFERLFRIIDTVGAKTVSQTDRYADDRVGNPSLNLVAPEGKRLRGGVSVWAIAAMVVFIGFWAWGFIGDMLP